MPTELDLIDRIAQLVSRRPGVELGIGDDAAVLVGSPQPVVALDIVVDGVHFRRATSSFADIGHFALAVNLSDLAAMGARPTAAVVGLSLPTTDPLTEADVEQLYRGMEALAEAHRVTIAGGDVTTAPTLSLAVTAIGHMAADVSAVRRSGARPGDALCITGGLGAAAAGLRLLDDPALAVGVADAPELIAALRRPTPRVQAGAALAAFGVNAMMDCSDGLALDAARLAQASRVHIEIGLESLPIAEGAAAVAQSIGADPDVFAATGGDDYELIVSLPERMVVDAAAVIDVPLTRIGTVTTGESGVTLRREGRIVRPDNPGWVHRL